MDFPFVFDTETSGLPDGKLHRFHEKQPHVVQLAGILFRTEDRTEIGSMNRLVKPNGWSIQLGAMKKHGITFERAMEEGIPIGEVMDEFNHLLSQADCLVAHQIEFDADRIVHAYHESGRMPPKARLPRFCTMKLASPVVNLPPTQKMVETGYSKKPKPPKLEECIQHLFGEPLVGAHEGMVDVKACARVFWELVDRGVVPGMEPKTALPTP